MKIDSDYLLSPAPLCAFKSIIDLGWQAGRVERISSKVRNGISMLLFESCKYYCHPETVQGVFTAVIIWEWLAIRYDHIPSRHYTTICLYRIEKAIVQSFCT